MTFFVGANSIQKAIIELSRGNGFSSRNKAIEKLPIEMHLWKIEITEENFAPKK